MPSVEEEADAVKGLERVVDCQARVVVQGGAVQFGLPGCVQMEASEVQAPLAREIVGGMQKAATLEQAEVAGVPVVLEEQGTVIAMRIW